MSTLMPIWIPILVTIIGLIWLFVLGRIIPGPIDEFLVTIIVFGFWIFYAFLTYIDSLIYHLSIGNPQAWITIGIIAVVVYMVIRWKRSK